MKNPFAGAAAQQQSMLSAHKAFGSVPETGKISLRFLVTHHLATELRGERKEP